jgi:NADH-quinone oxidoreductase subunit M
MLGFEADNLFLLGLWSLLTVAGLALYMAFQIRVFILAPPAVAVFGSGWILWSHGVNDSPLNLGVFFLFSLALTHMLSLMMLNPHAGGVRIKVLSVLSMLVTGWAYFVDSPWSFALLWGISIVPQALYFSKKESHPRNVFVAHHVLSVLALVAGLYLLEPAQGVWRLSNLTLGSAREHQATAVLLLILAAFIRQGIFPFHLWFKASYKTKPYPLNIGFYVGNLGFFLLVRGVMPIVEANFHHFTPYILGWGIISGLYFANMSFVQSRIRSSVFYVMLSQFSMLVCGLETSSVTGEAGVLFQFLSYGLSFGGLIACLYLLEWNLGELHSRRFHGLQERNPFLGLCFLLFCLAGVALPFTMGFVGEDLIFHAVIEKYPFVGLGLILAAALNGLSLFRVFSFLFRGKREEVLDDTITLAFWQKAAFSLLLILLFGFGIYPELLLRHVLSFV